MHGSRPLEPMNIRQKFQKFKENAEPMCSKKSIYFANQHNKYDHEYDEYDLETDLEQDTVPFWEQELDEFNESIK